MSSNHFAPLITAVEAAPPNQRTEKLITGIATQMQQSSVSQVQQLGQDLQSIVPQLVRACQQQG